MVLQDLEDENQYPINQVIKYVPMWRFPYLLHGSWINPWEKEECKLHSLRPEDTDNIYDEKCHFFSTFVQSKLN